MFYFDGDDDDAADDVVTEGLSAAEGAGVAVAEAGESGVPPWARNGYESP